MMATVGGPIIGNDPGFDPEAARHAVIGRARGRRFRNVLYAGLGLGVLGLITFQAWLLSGRDEIGSTIDIREARAEIPDYRPASEPPPLPQPAVSQPAPPLRIEHETVAQQAIPRRRDPRLPTRIAFDVQVHAEPDLSWFADGRRPRLAPGCALRPGASIIPAVLETTIQSEVPGQVIASVSEDVFDADGVGRLLIPQGTKVVGIYKDELEFQSRRMGIVWTELTMPDGTQLNLFAADGMDAAGSMGMGGEVTTVQILEPEPAPPFLRIGLRLSMNGDTATMRDFLYAVETRDPALIVSSMTLSSPESGAADVAADPVLNASFEIYGYAPAAIAR